MGQNITLKIAGKEYQLVVPTPEREGAMRRAASEINTMLAAYDQKFPEKTTEDKLAFVALGQTVSKFAAENKLKEVEQESLSLNGELLSYLKDKE